MPQETGSQSQQVYSGLRSAILRGRFAAGMRLPSTRGLAAQLGVQRNSVVLAYERLASDGLTVGHLGSGTFVASQLPRRAASQEQPVAASTTTSAAPFALGRAQADPSLLLQLGRLLRHGLAAGDPAHFGYGDARGSEKLRRAIADHLAVTRGVMCNPGQILITGGMQQAIRLCADTLLRPGDAAWVEDPGYPPVRRTLEALKARLVPVPVDGSGLDVGAGRQAADQARLAYVTPTHQFPTGVTMTMERRTALLDWARDVGSWILEDDYDSEFRYAGQPLTALAGIDGHCRVIYLGTFSKTLFAGLRVGYAVLPPDLVEPVTAARVLSDRFPASLMSDALAELIGTGGFATHIRRMRIRYRVARDIVATTLMEAASGLLRVSVPLQGLHLVALLPPEWPPGAASAIRAMAGVEAWLLSEVRMIPTAEDGFILGFSGHESADLRDAAERLGQAVRMFAETGPVAALGLP